MKSYKRTQVDNKRYSADDELRLAANLQPNECSPEVPCSKHSQVSAQSKHLRPITFPSFILQNLNYDNTYKIIYYVWLPMRSTL